MAISDTGVTFLDKPLSKSGNPWLIPAILTHNNEVMICRAPKHQVGKRHHQLFPRQFLAKERQIANRHARPDIGLRHIRRILITRARVEGFMQYDFESEYGTLLADLLSWYKQGLLKIREDIMEGVENVPHAFIRVLKGENFGKQLIKLSH